MWKTVEARKGQACRWGLLLGHLELGEESTSRSTQGTWPPGGGLRATSGRRDAAAPVGQLQRSNCPWHCPSHEPHETVPGERERDRTSEVGVKKLGWQMRCPPREGGSTVALDLLETSLKEFPAVWSSGEKGSLAVWLEETAASMIPTRDPHLPTV